MTPRTFPQVVSADAWLEAASMVGPQELAALYEASATLLRSADIKQTQDAIVLSARHLFGFDRAGLWLYDAEADCIRGTAGTDDNLRHVREDHITIPFDHIPAPMRQLLTGKEPFYLTQDLQEDLPQLSSVPNMNRVKANAVVPLRRGDEILGFLSVDNAINQQPISEAQVRLLLLFGNYAAAALYNALIAEQTREHLAEVELRRRLERKVLRLEQVHEVAAEITSLDLNDVLRLIRDRLLEVFEFDRAGILLLDPREPDHMLQTWGTDMQGQPVDERGLRFKIEQHADLVEITTGEKPFLLFDYESGKTPTEKGKPLHALIQLRSSEKLLGALSVHNDLTRRGITEEDLEILLLLAGHASLAIQKAHLYTLEQDVNARLRKVLTRESRIASTLQKAFKPTVGSRLYGVRIAHFYRSALAESDLGGDFYDVLDLGEGRIALVMADVSGKGLSAAARTARARYALQAFAYEDPSPCSVLNRLNRFLATQPDVPGSFVTVFYGVLDSNTGQLHCASAGHEPPVIMRPGEEPEFLHLSGVPCGIFPELECSEARLTLKAGDRFLLYSDGVTEARRDRQLYDFAGLQEALKEDAGYPPDTLVRRLYRRVLTFSGGAMRDDVALLIVEIGAA